MLGAEVAGVGLPMESSKFETFTQADYDAIYQELADGNIELVGNVDKDNKEVAVMDLPVTVVKVEEIA